MYALLVFLSSLSRSWRSDVLTTLLPLARSAETRSWEGFALLVLASLAVLGALLAWFQTRRQD
jgi:hypothetical protein